MRRLLSLLVCSAAVCLPAVTVPLTHETMWLMKRVGAPVPSPDGKWAVFPVAEPAYDDDKATSNLWLVPTDSSAKPRRLTTSKATEGGVSWHPDGKRIAFTAKYEGDEAAQVYVLDVTAAGKPVRHTALVNAAASPRFSPDGRMLLAATTLYPDAGSEEDNRRAAADRKNRRYKARVYDTFPIRNWDKWLDDQRPSLVILNAEPNAPVRHLLVGSRLADGKGFGGVRGNSGDDLQAVWAPDSQSIIFTATTNRNESAFASVTTALYQVPASGGEPKRLTPQGDSNQKPMFRPDGKALYCLHARESDRTYSLDRLAMFAWPTVGERSLVSAALDRSISSFAFSPDSRTAYVLVEEAGHDKLYSLPASGGDAKLAFDVARGMYANLAVPEKAAHPLLLATYESGTEPAEVVKLNPAPQGAEAKPHQLLSDFNVERASLLNWAPSREFWFTAKNGRRIHSLMTLPPNFDPKKKYPVFALIHGGPHTMAKDQYMVRWHSHLLASPGFVVIQTNYTGSTGFGETFAQAIQGDPLRGPGEEINEAVDYAVKEFPFLDGAKLAAGGASYGGHLANWLQATTTRYKCLISHAGLINLESQWGTSDTIYDRERNQGGPVWEQGPVWREQNPIRYAAKFRTPILLTVGENDFRVPLNQTLENWAVLQRMRVPSRLIVFPEASHWILKGEDSRFFYAEVLKWLYEHLG